MAKDRDNRLPDEKMAALRQYHALHRRLDKVTDMAFVSGDPFFDARDLVQIQYEMLRRVHQERQSVTQAAAAFGFSRPAFYQAQASFKEKGLLGLLPESPGPRRAHKLKSEVMDYIEQALSQYTSLPAGKLAEMVRGRFGLMVHPRSIERALVRCKKNAKKGHSEERDAQ